MDWRAIRFESPFGRWYLIHDEADRSRFAVKDKDGDMRIVMSRDELMAIERGISVEEDADEKKIVAQQLMIDLTRLKEIVPEAKLKWLKKTS